MWFLRCLPGPAGFGRVEAEVDEPAEVDRSDAGGEAVLVAFDAVVADAPVAVGDEPGDGALGLPRVEGTSELACPGGQAWKDVPMPKPYPQEFRDDVVKVARNRPEGTTLEQIAKDFGIHPMTLSGWMKNAAVEAGEQENEVLRRAAAYLGQASLPKG